MQSSDTKMTAEQIEFLQNELDANFGRELEALKCRLDKDMKHLGYVTKKTIKERDKLMEKILEEKHRNDDIQRNRQ